MVFDRQWALRRHWAHVRVVSTRYRASRSKSRHVGGLAFSIPNVAPDKRRPKLEARLKRRREKQLAGNIAIRVHLATINKAMQVQTQVQKVKRHLAMVTRRVAQQRAAEQADREALRRSLSIEMRFVDSQRAVVLQFKVVKARRESIKVLETQDRKITMADNTWRDKNRRAAVKVKVARLNHDRMVRQQLGKLQQHALHGRRVRLRKQLMVREEEEGLKAVQPVLEQPVLRHLR